MKTSIIASVAVALVAFSASASYCTLDITMSGYPAERNAIPDFPVLVRVSTAIAGFQYQDIASDFSNLKFTDVYGDELPYEIDTWNTDGESLIWVKVPSLASNGTFQMVYGDYVERMLPATDVWNGYVAVWHMGEASGTAVDSTGNGYDAAATGDNAAGMIGVAGLVGGARQITSSDLSVGQSYFKTAKKLSEMYTAGEDPAPFTVIMSFNTQKYSFGKIAPMLYNRLDYKAADGFTTYIRDWGNGGDYVMNPCGSGNTTVPSITIKGGHAAGDDNLGAWRTVFLVYNGENWVNSIIDGNTDLMGGGAIVDPNFNNEDYIGIGGAPETGNVVDKYADFCGYVDEVRIYKGIVNGSSFGDYAWATREQSVNANFLSYGAVNGASVPQITPVVTRLADAKEENLVEGRFRVSIDAAQSADVRVNYTLSGDAEPGTDYEPLPGHVVIPAGETSAVVTVLPLLNIDSEDSHVLTLSIAAGTYLDSDSSATMTIHNYHPLQTYYTMPITIVGLAEGVALSGFPLLVRLSEEIDGFTYEKVGKPARRLTFIDENGNRLPCEIEKWDTAGTSYVWVRVPSLRNGTVITCAFGSGAVPVSRKSTWSDYAAVWHFNETTGMAADSAENGFDAAPSLSQTGVPGIVAGARHNADYVSERMYFDVNQNLGGFHDVGELTFSCWLKPSELPVGDNQGNKYYPFMATRDARNSGDGFTATFRTWSDNTQNSDTYCYIGSGSLSGWNPFDPAPYIGNWMNLTYVFSGGSAKLYRNGVLVNSATATLTDAAGSMWIGGSPSSWANGSFAGDLDEFRLRRTAVSDDWVKAEYDNIAGASAFYTFGAVAEPRDHMGFTVTIR